MSIILTCAQCRRTFDRGYRISRTRAAKKQFCTAECQRAFYARPAKACEVCGKLFHARSATVTRFCSTTCSVAGLAVSSDGKARRAAGLRKAHAEGRVTVLRMAEKPNWKGGRKAYQQRRTASGETAAALRAYRKANPDKVREFSQRRRGRELGRLPRGTLPAIRKAQRNKCAICTTPLRGGSHVDHIIPLARGGKHEARNIQLLCAHCNLTKSDRDPILHMQSLGKLI